MGPPDTSVAPTPAATCPMGKGKAPGKVVVGSHSPVSNAELGAARAELDRLLKLPGMRLPQRSFMEDEPYLWRFGAPPDYTLADLHFLKGKTMKHKEGSLEQVVEDLVKTWEFERSHKLDPTQHKTVHQEKFSVSSNGGERFGNAEANRLGNYNVLLHGVSPTLWPRGQSWDETHHLFKAAFPSAFPWEVLSVFSAPPKVAFSWRHWAHFTGSYRGNKGKGELVELYGFATAVVSPELKLQDLDIFYKPEEFLAVLEGTLPASSLSRGMSLVGAGCPVSGQHASIKKGRGQDCACSIL